MMSQITIGGSSERKPSAGSCAECRRSKLRCDRVFPCQTCIRRGCGDLCPYGTMAATKGNRVLMAHAQQLEKQVKGMQSRIEELESALKAQSNGNDLHPLVQQGSLDHAGLLTFDEDDIDEVTDAVDALSLGAGGQARYHGLTASSETLQGLIHPPTADSVPDTSDPQYLDLNPELIELFNAFPMGLTHRIFNKSYFNEYLPTREHAIALIDRYYVHFCLWEPIRQQDFFENILSPIYTSAARPSAESVHAHQLSLFFILLASAGIHDKNPSSVFQRQQYHALARAAFSLEPIAREVTTASTQALFIIIWYLHLSDANSIEERWLLGGVCAKTAQTVC
ncbi:hypothetical protein FIBSPDRAFT_199814 [Athelia psychrophila]|uniref:Zn(2)-C6 fungal-type domain-containing protein n=1 Tax=Athelia psychrophila TaxID=1759441 RepID=A0A165ZN72_9AGAM|nr:hypothetical protein FIBSPDRAFT_199814 [Fibularhizoctonia sp. CBS 109695]